MSSLPSASKSVSVSEELSSLWKKACLMHERSAVSKTDPLYPAVLKWYQEHLPVEKKVERKEWEAHAKTPQGIAWAKSCKELGYDFVKKGTASYDQVMALYRVRVLEEQEKANS